jgi:hypothetical protein
MLLAYDLSKPKIFKTVINAIRLHCTAFRKDMKKHLSVLFRNAIVRRIIATERCCFAQLLKVVHSVSDRCFFALAAKTWFLYGRND